MSKKAFGPVLAFCLVSTFGAAAQAQSILEKIKRDGVLKVCMPQIVPDLYKDPKTGEWTGVMADLLNTLATWI